MSITLNKLYPGKLDHEFLQSLLLRHTSADARTIQGAKVGEDATVIDMGDRCLVAKTDPITFAVDNIGHYAVHVNSNDIVCMGATPKWFLATILLPEQSTRQLVEKIFCQIADVCKQENIAYCGGHTEVTLGLDRPIIVGQMLGEVQKQDLLLKQNAQVGDHIVLVQAAPIEATSVLAGEKSKVLEHHFSIEFVRKCRNLLFDPGISIRRYAALALQSAAVHAMHDPTEGGIATGVAELAMAANAGVRIVQNKIPLLTEGKLVCDYFELDPLGCIASGSLLLAVPFKSIAPMLNAFEKAAIPAADIGKLLPPSAGLGVIDQGKEVKLSIFARDEITKII